MPVTIQTNKVKFKDPNNQGFITLDAIGSESAQEIQSKINSDVSNALKNLNDATAAANASADTIAQAVSAAVAQGTDTTLTLSGVPADAKAVGDQLGDLKSALGLSSVTAQSTVKISGATIIGKTITNPYASTNIYGPISVQKGDSVTVTGINCNSALTALSYCDENVTIVYDIISAGNGADLTQEYTVTSDRDGYIAIVSTTQATPSYNVDRFALKATYDNEIEEINNALDENSIANYVVPYESTNVFDATAITPGKLCNGYGTFDDNPSAIVTDFYAVSPGDKVRFTPYSPNINQSIYVFKADGTVLATGYYPRTDYDDYSEITIPSGNNAGAKFRLNIFFRDFTDTVITINQPFSRSLAGQKGKYFALNQYDYESRLFGKFITYNGDSICEGRYYGTTSNGGAYANIISRLTGSRAENRAISGGILASAVPSGTTPQRLIVNDITNMSDDADLVCLEGGYNDYARDVPLGEITPEKEITAESAIATLDTTTICGALESIFRQARLKWLGKPIVFVIVHKVQNSYYTNNTASTPYTFKDVHDKIVQICNKYAIPYYDACLYSGLNGHDVNQSNAYLTSNYTGNGDGTHPNEAGYRRYYVPQLIELFESVMPRLAE